MGEMSSARGRARIEGTPLTSYMVTHCHFLNLQSMYIGGHYGETWPSSHTQQVFLQKTTSSGEGDESPGKGSQAAS